MNHLNTEIILNIRNVTINALMNMFFYGAYDMQSYIGEKPSINDFFEFITEVRSAL